MKFRKLFPAGSKATETPAPPVPAASNEEAEYARAIAQAIVQGLPGEQFARVVNMMKPDAVKIASEFELAECLAWFKRDAEACRILESTPGFDVFAAAFHAEARRLYPGIVI